MDALVSAIAGRIGRGWASLVAHLRDENSVAAIAARVAIGDYHNAMAGLDRAASAFAAAELGAYTAAGQATAKWLHGELNQVRKKLSVFDPQEPGAVRWAEQNRLDKIREVTAGQRDAIREALVDGARTGANPRDTARRIRDSIGLTDHQERIVNNYRLELQRGQLASALDRELSSGHSDKTIAAALRNRTPLTQAQIDTAVERYRDNWIKYRAENIARTEGLRVAHQASEELYRQAVEHGDIEASQIERTWNHSPGAKNKKNERVFHLVMVGQVRGYGEKFVSGLGGELRYPGDPEASGEETCSCRCCLSTRIRPPAGAAGQQQGAPRAAEEAPAGVDVADEEAVAAEEEALAAEDQAAAEEDAAAQEAQAAADDLAAAEAEPIDDVLTPDELAAIADRDRLAAMSERAPLDEGATDALARGDYQALSSTMRDDLEARWGLARRDAADDTFTAARPASPGADAARSWDGWIGAKPEVYQGAEAFSRRWAMNPAAARADLEAMTPLELYSRNDTFAAGDGMRVLVHEQIHGYGPVTRSLYTGQAAAIEEVATEVMARTVMREEFGLNLRSDHAYGAYRREIKATLDAIQEVGGVSVDDAWTVLERASLDFKQMRPSHTNGPDDIVDAFVDRLARRMPGGSTAATRRELRAVLERPGTLAAP